MAMSTKETAKRWIERKERKVEEYKTEIESHKTTIKSIVNKEDTCQMMRLLDSEMEQIKKCHAQVAILNSEIDMLKGLVELIEVEEWHNREEV